MTVLLLRCIHSHEKRLLTSSCTSVCPPVLTRLSLDVFHIGDVMKVCQGTPHFVTIGQKCWMQCPKTKMCFRLWAATYIAQQQRECIVVFLMCYICSTRVERMYCCVSVTACNIYYIFAAKCRSAIQQEHTVAFPWQQWVHEYARMYLVCLVSFPFQTSCDISLLIKSCFAIRSVALHTDSLIIICLLDICIYILVLAYVFCGFNFPH